VKCKGLERERERESIRTQRFKKTKNKVKRKKKKERIVLLSAIGDPPTFFFWLSESALMQPMSALPQIVSIIKSPIFVFIVRMNFEPPYVLKNLLI
jgi:hypothetical protein